MRKIMVFACCAIAILLAGFVVANERGRGVPATNQSMLQFNPTDVNELIVRNNTGESVVVVRDKGRWEVQDGAHTLADPKQVTAAIDALAEIPASAPIATTETAHEYGLQPATFDIVIARGSDTLAELKVGTNDSANDLVFAAAGGPAVYRVSNAVLAPIEQWLQQPPTLVKQ